MGKEHGSHWEYGYDPPCKRTSEAHDRFFSEERRLVNVNTSENRSEPESLQLGIVLRRSSVALGVGCLKDGAKDRVTEQRLNYVKKPSPHTHIDGDPGKDSRKGNIDHSYGHPKNCKDWIPEQLAVMSAHSVEKYKAERPSGFEALAKELRKSSVPIPNGPHIPLDGVSSLQSAFTPKWQPMAENLASTLGKDLRASHIDLGGGAPRPGQHWMSMQQDDMTRHAQQKFANRKQAGFDDLAVELRKSNVPLAGAPTSEFMQRSSHMLAKGSHHFQPRRSVGWNHPGMRAAGSSMKE